MAPGPGCQQAVRPRQRWRGCAGQDGGHGDWTALVAAPRADEAGRNDDGTRRRALAMRRREGVETEHPGPRIGLEDGWCGRVGIGQQATRPGWAEALLDAAAVQPRDGRASRHGRRGARGGPEEPREAPASGPHLPLAPGPPFLRFLPCRAPGTEYLALHRRSAGMRAPPGARSGRVAVPQHACRLAASKRGRIFGPQAPTARPTFRPPCGIEGSVLGIPPLARPPKAAQGIYSVCPSRPPPPTPPHSGKANASTTTTPASRARPTP